MTFKILELFSGIGGMHSAFEYSQLEGKVIAAYDINQNANMVYAFNHPQTIVKNNNIQSLTPETIEKLGANTILMSPPCQPHTRVGKGLDVDDNRSDGLQHICNILPLCEGIRYVLMENVKGFEKSKAREAFIEALQSSGFHICEFILSPTQFGIPNSRNRYYCLARKSIKFPFSTENILEQIPDQTDDAHFVKRTLKEIIEPEGNIPAKAFVKENDLLKRVYLMDIVTLESTNTMCFTKAYTHYAEGTGSVITSLARSEVNEIFQKLRLMDAQKSTDEERLELLKKLHLRYFTPNEVARLMSFPHTFGFPTCITVKQKYRLLGNSINVHVVGELIKLLCS